MISGVLRRNQSRSSNGHGIDTPMGHPRPGNGGRSISGPTTIDWCRWFGLDRCNGHGLKVRPRDRGTPCLLRVHGAARFGSSSSSPIWPKQCTGAFDRPCEGARRRYFGLGWRSGRTLCRRDAVRTDGVRWARLGRRQTSLQLARRPRRPDRRPQRFQIPSLRSF